MGEWVHTLRRFNNASALLSNNSESASVDTSERPL